MSSESDSASSAPADARQNPQSSPSAENATDSPAASHAEASVDLEGEARRKGPPIRIGTQRYGVKPPVAVPKPVLPSPPVSQLAQARGSAEEESTSPERPPGSAGSTAQPSNVAPDSISEAAPASGKRDKKSAGNKPRGSRSMSEQPQARKFPPPNTRGQLSPDLEIEFLEALGGESLDEIIAAPKTRKKGRVK